MACSTAAHMWRVPPLPLLVQLERKLWKNPRHVLHRFLRLLRRGPLLLADLFQNCIALSDLGGGRRRIYVRLRLRVRRLRWNNEPTERHRAIVKLRLAQVSKLRRIAAAERDVIERAFGFVEQFRDARSGRVVQRTELTLPASHQPAMETTVLAGHSLRKITLRLPLKLASSYSSIAPLLRSTVRQKKDETQSFMFTCVRSTLSVWPVPMRSMHRPQSRKFHTGVPGATGLALSVSVITWPTGRLNATQVAASCMFVAAIE